MAEWSVNTSQKNQVSGRAKFALLTSISPAPKSKFSFALILWYFDYLAAIEKLTERLNTIEEYHHVATLEIRKNYLLLSDNILLALFGDGDLIWGHRAS